MRISHEVPICMLEKSKEFNDYSYVLAHLMDGNPIYRDFYTSLRHDPNWVRPMILDNSAYELQHLDAPYNKDMFASWIEQLKPHIYIIPDVFNSMESTVESTMQWVNDINYSTLPGLKMGVIQGSSIEEMIQCYKTIEPVVDLIGISFGLNYYLTSSTECDSKDTQHMRGRISLIHELVTKNAINKSKPHHLLGCSLPQEFTYYTNIPWITSVDTSNPILCTYIGELYKPWGLRSKPTIKTDDIINTQLTAFNPEILKHNLTMFRYFANWQPLPNNINAI